MRVAVSCPARINVVWSFILTEAGRVSCGGGST
jgi:hypothetical protein